MERVYVVKRILWNYSDEWHYPDDDRTVKAFRLREDAKRYQRRLEADARSELMNTQPEQEYSHWSNNLAQTFGGVENLTSLSQHTLRQRLSELNLPYFPTHHTDDMVHGAYSPAWWHHAWATLHPDHYETFWDLFDRVAFFQVLEVEVYS